MTNNKRYIGDSVYADVDRGMIVLTTENGLPGAGASNTIYLEPSVLVNLVDYANQAPLAPEAPK